MAGIIKLAAGVALGIGVAAVATKLAQRRAGETAPLAEGSSPSGRSGIIARLQTAGEAARAVRAEREAELRARFRQRVGDPSAFTADAPETLP